MIKDQIAVRGSLFVTVHGPDGLVRESKWVKNLVVNAGLALVAARVAGGGTAPTHMALGTGAVAAAGGNTTLGAEVGRVTLAGAAASGAEVTFTATFPAGTATGAITEAGIFNAGSNGTMLSRTVFPVLNKQAGDTISVSWVLTFA